MRRALFVATGIFCLIFFLVPERILSQQTNGKTLLWRITGKNLAKPSYLFGTIHLTDKKLFFFGDSVYTAIENTQGFAIELNPDEFSGYLVNNMFDALQAKKIKEILSEKEFDKYGTQLSKKLNKPAGDITTSDILREKNKWMNELMGKNTMATFVDAYLYNIARRQGKWVGGIEDLSDQTGLLNELVDKSDIAFVSSGDTKKGDNSLNKMMQLYQEEDIEGINRMADDGGQQNRDILLTRRNIKMARRMDSLSAFRSMFFAVGAAHLPGDSGVIAMLRSRGFTVEPVYSTAKKDAALYTYKEVPQPWTTVKGEKKYYQVQMPGNPASIKLFGIIEMKFLVDIFTMTGYGSMCVPSSINNTNKDSVFKVFASRIFGDKKTYTSKAIAKDAAVGYEYSGPSKDAFLRVQIFLKNNIIYLALVSAAKEEAVSSEQTKHFFDSFTISSHPDISSGSVRYTDSLMGLSFVSPVKLERNEKMEGRESADSWKVRTYMGMDAATGSFVILITKQTEPGQVITNDSTLLNEYNAKFKKQYKLKDSSFLMDGHPALKLEGANEQGIGIQILAFIRNQRNILLMVFSNPGHMKDSLISGIYTSLQLLPYKEQEWTLQAAPHQDFVTKAPIPFRVYDSTSNQLISFDSVTNNSFIVIRDTLAKYEWMANDSLFYNKKVRQYYTVSDSLINTVPVKNGGVNGYEYLISKGKKERYKKVRILVNGNIVYSLVLNGDREAINNKNALDFFTDFKFSRESVLTARTPKTDLLLNDLMSNDSAIQLPAINAINSVQFSSEDIPKLNSFLLQVFPVTDDSAVKTDDDINYKLSKKLAKLGDPSTVQTIIKTYDSLQGAKAYLRNSALNALALFKTKESYDAFARLMLHNPPTKSFELTGYLTDSLRLIQAEFPVLRSLATDSLQGLMVATIARTLMDSGLISMDSLLPNMADFVKLSNRQFPKQTSIKSSETDSRLFDLIQLLAAYKTPESVAALRKYLQIKDEFLKEETAYLLLKMKKTVAPAVINTLAALPSVRAELYYDLKEIHQLNLFPAAYLNQQSLAESDLYSIYADDGDDKEGPDGIRFLETAIGNCNGENYRFYLFKIISGKGAEARSYLGIAGGYGIKDNNLEVKVNYSRIDYDTELKDGNRKELFKACLAKINQPDSE